MTRVGVADARAGGRRPSRRRGRRRGCGARGRPSRAGSAPVGVADVVAEDLRAERHRAGGGPGVGVEQQLGRVAAHAAGRVVGAGARGSRTPGRGRRPRRSRARRRRRSPAGRSCVSGAGVVEQAQQHPLGDVRRPPRSWSRRPAAWRRAGSRRPGPHAAPVDGRLGGGHWPRLRPSTSTRASSPTV